ncbi:ornithine carbamoyltransferase [Marinobacterium nitratireducens]|uniref:Ornithine carbamoyltransferase n=1 Tax=Marinobacterium nitratireducens TaxID=518897 RepID=A0A917ZHF3_9GAMM|nr:ornithine carbamoyltransferase [Marinobacterium nitratireducens]GGO83061.1 ornithine carbamoyltransferase [Marinobacterium nitratireducens]
MGTRHFLTLNDLTPDEFKQLIVRAGELKQMRNAGEVYEPLQNHVMAMIFEKASTRTRVSFEAGMAQLGGHAMFLSSRDTQLGRGEPIEDSARVISSMVDVVMIRTFEHATVETFARYSRVPVINALTDDYHPCQLLADMQAYHEHRGSIQGKTAVWIGDGNNMCNSWINAAALLDFRLHICCPEGFEPMQSLLEQHADRVRLFRDPEEAVKGTDLVSTDVWASMGQEEEAKAREKQFTGFQVSPALMDLANPDAVFLHCLPAHRGEEISEDMLDDPRSIVFDEAENRLHAQKALLEFLLVN